MALDPEVSAAIQEARADADRKVQRVEAELRIERDRVTELEGLVRRMRRQGLEVLDFRQLFPKSGDGNNGTSRQAARSDHTHP